MRRCYELANGRQDVAYNAFGSIGVIFGNKLPNFVKVGEGFRMKVIPGHECRERCAAILASKYASTSSPGMSFALPLLRSS